MVNDDKSSAAVLARHFVKGSAPKDTRKFPLYAYDVEDKPTVTGDTGTAKVNLKNEQKGTTAANQEWTFVREGDAWKIKSAPLP